MSIQSLLDEAMAVRWPDRGGVVIPPGRYTVKETLVIDPGPFTDTTTVGGKAPISSLPASPSSLTRT
jgi:hypothetical protein